MRTVWTVVIPALLGGFVTFHGSSSAYGAGQGQWPKGWAKVNGRWKIENGVLSNVGKGFASFDSTRKDLQSFDLHFTFTRKKEYEPGNHVGVIVERGTGRWRILFSGSKVAWFYVPIEAFGKEKHGIFKGEKPCVCALDAKVDVVLQCRQQGLSLLVNGTRLAQFGPTPGSGRVLFYAYRVETEIADLQLRPEKSAAQPETVVAMNLLANPSFEICTNPDLPDGWTHEPGWGNEADERWFKSGGYDQWHESWKVETRGARHGKRCVRVRHPLELHGMVFQMVKGRHYAISAHLRADRENFGVYLGAQTPGQPKQGRLVSVDKTWKRYVVKLEPYALPAHPYASVCIIPSEKWGTLWVDAVQAEKGTEPSAFTPHSPLDGRFAGSAPALDAGPKRTFIPEARIAKPYEAQVKLDGVLDESLWAAAKRHVLCSTNGGATHHKTEVRFAATPKGLLIGARAAAPGKEPLGGERDRDAGAVFGDDSLEVFVDPVGEGREYYQFVSNAYGAQFDQKCRTGRGVDPKWNGQWAVATKIQDGLWTAEALIPFSDLFPGDAFPDGSAIRVNVCRNVQPTKELQNWSPTYGVFHSPDRFGFVYLGALAATSRPTASPRERKAEDIQAFYELNYYTRERVAALFLKALFDGHAKASVEVRSPRGEPVFTQSAAVTPDRFAKLDIPVETWIAGEYPTHVSWRASSGKVVQKELTLKKLKPSAVREAKIDHLRRTISVDGRPLFPFGPLWTRWARAEALLFVHEAGFNTIWAGDKWTPIPAEARYLSLLDRLGLNLVETRYLHYWKDAAAKQQTDYMSSTRDRRCVIARLYIDEPGRDPEKVHSLLAAAERLNPYVPSYVNYNSWGLYQRFAGLPGPIMSVDRYPIGSGRPDEIYTVEKALEFMEREAAPRRMPVWAILQSMGHRRTPTPSELNFMTYISIIRGARGICYWAGIPRAKGTWERMKELSREVRTLAPILFSIEHPPEVKARPEPTVTAIAKQYDGATYVIALNRSRLPCNGHFFVAGDKPLRCKVLFESREVPVKGNKFTDAFDGFERHVYELRWRTK